MKKCNTLLLVQSRDFYYFDRIDSQFRTVAPVFRNNSKIINTLCKFARKIKTPLTFLFYDNWYKTISTFDKIIVFDMSCALDDKLLYNIRMAAPHAERYVYSWNIVRDDHEFLKSLNNAKINGFSYYSYDRNDCQRFNLEFNTIMYDASLITPTNQTRWDVLFLGFLKDRKDKMVSLQRSLLQSELNPHFVIVDKTGQHSDLPFDVRDNYVSYTEYLDMLKQSRAILDITQHGQNGFSMRVMESIFLGKKLISTNTALLDADFYDPNNILVVDSEKMDISAIQQFMSTDFHPYPKEVQNYYSIDSWINRFTSSNNEESL